MATKKPRKADPKIELPDISNMRSITTVSPPSRTASGDGSAAVSHQSSKVSFGGRQIYPKTVRSCSICTNREERDLIEHCIRMGDTARNINELLSPDTKPLHRQTIKTHREHHMVYSESVTQVLMRRNAEKLGIDYEEIGSMLTLDHISDTVVREAYRQVTAGLVEFKGSDVTALMKLLVQRDHDAGGNLDQNTFAMAMVAVIEVAKKHIQRLGGDRDMQWFSAELSEHPLVRAMLESASSDGAPPPPKAEPVTLEMLNAAEIIEVPVVDDDEDLEEE